MIRTQALRIASLAVSLILVIGPASAQSAAPNRGEKYAFLVGVREYDPAELKPLKFSEADINGLAEVLRRSGYRPESVKVLTQAIGASRTRFLPTGANIRRELDLLLKPLSADDSVIVALAGHGVQFLDSEESYFCPADARLGDRSSLIPLSETHRALEECRAAFKLLLVDACRNDPLTATSRDAGGRAVVDLPSLSRPIVRRPLGGVATLFSCSAGEIAFENTELKHGVFFHFVIKGLEGEADGDGDGKVDLLELSNYTTKRVFQFVDNTFGREQTPEMLNKTRGSVAIVELHQPRPAPASTPPEPASPPQIERDRPAPASTAPVSTWDTDRDRVFAEFLRDKSRGMVRKAAVGIERRGDLRIQLDRSVAPEDTLPLTKSIMAGAQHDFPDRPITLSVYDPNGNPILKASYRPGEGVHYQIARDGAATRRDGAEPGWAAGADPLTRKGVTEADRRFAAWAEEHGHAFLRYVQADLERHGRLWFGVTRDVKPEDVPELTKSLLQGAQKDFPGRDLVATVFDPEGERIGQAHLGADGQVRWDR